MELMNLHHRYRFLYGPVYKTGQGEWQDISRIRSFYTDPPIKRVSQELYLIAILSSFYTDQPIKRVDRLLRNGQNQLFLYRPAY